MIANELTRPLNQLWWLSTLQGMLAVFFGITAIFWPGLTLLTLVYLFSAFILSWGLVEIVTGLTSIDRRGTWIMTLVFGLIGLGVGIYLVRHPAVSFHTFILLVGLTLIARGILDIVRAFLEVGPTAAKVLLALAGVAAVAAGILILLQPVGGGIAFVWILGLYALIFGSLIIVSSIELHNDLNKLLEI